MFSCACNIANCEFTCQEDHVTTPKTTNSTHYILDTSAQLHVFLNGILIFSQQCEPVPNVHFSIYNKLFSESAMAMLTVLTDLIIWMAVHLSRKML